MVFGYCRISTAKQNIERQVRNIRQAFPDAEIRQEVYTGTKYQGRQELKKILDRIKPNDTLVFDSVSRMSRNAEEGTKLYFELYNKGVNLVFLKESYINTAVYKDALKNQISMTGQDVDLILAGVNKYLERLAVKQIQIAFDQAQKEVDDLHQRTKEGIETARKAGKVIGGANNKDKNLITKKSIKAKELIRKHSKSFGGSLDNKEIMRLADITEPTLLKYKKAIRQGMIEQGLLE